MRPAVRSLLVGVRKRVDGEGEIAAAVDGVLADDELLDIAACCDRVVVELGGGPRGIEVRALPETAAGPMLIIHLIYDCRDAMGANMVI